jgi:homoserine O-acetyltransferase
VRNVCVIASTPHLTARNIAFHYLARKAILEDHNFNWNNFSKYGQTDVRGLASSFMLEHLSRISFEKLEETFGRELRNKLNFSFDVDFEIESFLEYTATPARYFDPSTYLFMSKAYDYFDLYKIISGEPNQQDVRINPNYLVISFTSDWKFPPQRSIDIVDFLTRKHCGVIYEEIESDHGNDSYLMPIPHYNKVVGDYFMKVADE